MDLLPTPYESVTQDLDPLYCKERLYRNRFKAERTVNTPGEGDVDFTQHHINEQVTKSKKKRRPSELTSLGRH